MDPLTFYTWKTLTNFITININENITEVLFDRAAWLKALAWQLMSSGGKSMMGTLVAVTTSMQDDSLTISCILSAASIGALCVWRLSLVHLLNQWPNHAKWQPHRKGLSDMYKPPVNVALINNAYYFSTLEVKKIMFI